MAKTYEADPGTGLSKRSKANAESLNCASFVDNAAVQFEYYPHTQRLHAEILNEGHSKEKRVEEPWPHFARQASAILATIR